MLLTITWLGASFQVIFLWSINSDIVYLSAFLTITDLCFRWTAPSGLVGNQSPNPKCRECSGALSALKKPIQGDTIKSAGFPDGGRDACQVS